MKAEMQVAILVSLAMAAGCAEAADRAAVAARVQAIADGYLTDRAAAEGATGISISVGLPGDPQALNVVAGRVSTAADAAPVTPETLFQIGSISKSFTAAAILRLEAEGKLHIDDTLGRWLPEYPAWKDVTLRRLLDMTSGIPGYDQSDAALATFAAIGAHRHFTPAVLAAFVDPTNPGVPAATTGYDYSNTNFVLAGMVIERASGRSVREEFETRFFEPLGLDATYYREGVYPAEITGRTASGYFGATDVAPLAGWKGRDMKEQDMSWAGAAGAIVSRPQDVNAWVRALFQSDLLDAPRKAELTTVVSMDDGSPIGSTSVAHPRGFGLGAVGFTAAVGSGWTYEGESMGYRVVYIFLPEKDLVATVAVNSAPSGDEDHASKTALAVIEAALE